MRVEWGGEGSRALFAELDVRMNPGNRRLNRGNNVTDTSLEFHDRKAFETWLRTQPHEVADVLAVRAALRVLPRFMRLYVGTHRDSYLNELLPLLRSIAAIWVTAEFSSVSFLQFLPTSIYSASRSTGYRIANHKFVPSFANSAAANFAAKFAFSMDEGGKIKYIWDILVSEGRLIVGGLRLRELASRPLWMFDIKEDAGIQKNLWEQLKHGLFARDENWQVWTTWWEARRDGFPADEEKELARLSLPEEMWEEGARTLEGVKAVNAEIARRFAEIDERRSGQTAATRALEEVFGQSVDLDVDLQVPPVTPVGLPLPAVRFTTTGEVVDVLPFAEPSGTSTEAMAGGFHAAAVALVEKLATRFAGSNAPEHLVASVAVAEQVLGASIFDVQPDRLRRLSTRISANARSYAHPQAEWEISAESVSDLFELSDNLDDLQTYYVSPIGANVAAIHRMALTPKTAQALREANDRIEEVIEAAEGVVSARAVDTFVAERILSGVENAPIEPDGEAERAFLAANMINALARNLNRDDQAALGVTETELLPRRSSPERPADDGVAKSPQEASKSPRPKRITANGVRRDAPSWRAVGEETIRHIKRNAPKRVGDAVLDAVTKTIKTAPLSIPTLAATLYGIAMSNPILYATPGVAAATAWIGYALWKRKKSDPRTDSGKN